jgi:hypothetical protein
MSEELRTERRLGCQSRIKPICLSTETNVASDEFDLRGLKLTSAAPVWTPTTIYTAVRYHARNRATPLKD